MRVTLYVSTDQKFQGEIVATFRLVHNTVIVEPAPGEAELATRILGEEIGWFINRPKGQGMRGITAQSHPSEWLENLQREHHGSRMWASPPQEP